MVWYKMAISIQGCDSNVEILHYENIDCYIAYTGKDLHIFTNTCK